MTQRCRRLRAIAWVLLINFELTTIQSCLLGPRDATGFALDEDEDDVYDGDIGKPNAQRYADSI
jgi:hypothetical protein